MFSGTANNFFTLRIYYDKTYVAVSLFLHTPHYWKGMVLQWMLPSVHFTDWYMVWVISSCHRWHRKQRVKHWIYSIHMFIAVMQLNLYKNPFVIKSYCMTKHSMWFCTFYWTLSDPFITNSHTSFCTVSLHHTGYSPLLLLAVFRGDSCICYCLLCAPLH